MCLMVFLAFKFLAWYTDHGESITVPDLRGKSYKEIDGIVEEYGLRYHITDSIWRHGEEKGIVLEQSPEAEDQVKKDRTIYLTVNRFTNERVSLPMLNDLSERQAIAKIKSSKLKLGKVTYRPSEGCCYILGWRVKGKQLEPGTLVDRGTKVDIVVGMGMSKEFVSVPGVKGLTKEQALEVLFENSLTIGGEHFDPNSVFTREDSLKAKVYKQIPGPGANSVLLMGSGVTLYFTLDTLHFQGQSNLKDTGAVK